MARHERKPDQRLFGARDAACRENSAEAFDFETEIGDFR